MKLIVFDYLNIPRMNILVSQFLQPKANDMGYLSSPQSVAVKEPLFFGRMGSSGPKCSIFYGISFDKICALSRKNVRSLRSLISTFRDEEYITTIGLQGRARQKMVVLVALKENISALKKTKAYFHAYYLSNMLTHRKVNFKDKSLVDKIEVLVKDRINNAWEIFALNADKSGWDLSSSEFQSDGYVIEIA